MVAARFTRVIGLVALACAATLVSSPTAQSRRAESSAARSDENLLVALPATAPWTDTGIDVHAGDRLSLRSWGRVAYGRAESVTPASPTGIGQGRCRFVLVDPSVPADIVIANIAPAMTFDGRGFVVGRARAVVVPVQGSTAPEGRLFLGINHQGIMCDRSGYDSWEFRNNGSGSFTAEIAVRRKK